MEKEISIKVLLDQDKMPEKIQWKASDASTKLMDCKAFQLTLWDGADHAALRVDIWAKDMYLEEMDHFYFQTLMSMADAYQRATNKAENAELIRNFAKEFGEKLGVVKTKN